MGTHFCRLGKYAFFRRGGGHLRHAPQGTTTYHRKHCVNSQQYMFSKCYIGGTHGTPTVYHRGIRLSNKVYQLTAAIASKSNNNSAPDSQDSSAAIASECVMISVC